MNPRPISGTADPSCTEAAACSRFGKTHDEEFGIATSAPGACKFDVIFILACENPNGILMPLAQRASRRARESRRRKPGNDTGTLAQSSDRPWHFGRDGVCAPAPVCTLVFELANGPPRNRPSPGSALAADSHRSGRKIVKIAPRQPGRFFAVIVPAWASIKPRQIARPSPVPLLPVAACPR
jgi:hypothetical protein